MAINRIEQLQRTTSVTTTDDSQVGRSKRLELDTESSFERGSDSDFDPANFQSAFSDEQRRTAEERFQALSVSDQAAVNNAVTKVYLGLNGVRTGSSTTAEVGEAFTAALTTYSSALYGISGLHASRAPRRGSGDQSEVTDIMVRVMGHAEDQVAAFAMDLQGKLNMKADLRTQATELADMVAHWPEGVDKQHFSWTSYDVDPDTGRVQETHHQADLTKEEAMDLQKDLQSQLDTLSDVTQMQQLDLQQKYQAQQEFMSTLSEILRSMHDTMKNTIANVKAS